MEIDGDNLVAVVEPGIRLEELRRELEEKSLRFLPATPDKDNLTLGEMFRNRISSLNSRQYGEAKHHVMGLEVILSSGEKLKSGGKTVKNVTGYDLTKLFISSYESLGIPVRYLLKLYPLPEKRIYLLLKSKDDEALLELALKIRENTSPAVLYFINAHIVRHIDNSPGDSWLLLSFEGYEDTVNLNVQLTRDLANEETDKFELIDEASFYNWIKNLTTNKQAVLDRMKLDGTLWKHCSKQEKSVGYFGQLDAGKLHIYLKERDKLIQIQEMIEGLGGYYYKKELSALSKGLKRVLDPNCILNPWVLDGRLADD